MFTVSDKTEKSFNPFEQDKFAAVDGDVLEQERKALEEFEVRTFVVVVVVVYFILSRLLYLAFSASLGLLCMPHPGMGPLAYRTFRRTAE